MNKNHFKFTTFAEGGKGICNRGEPSRRKTEVGYFRCSLCMKIFASKADAVDHVKKKTCFINVISRGGVNDGTTSDEEELFDIHDKNNAAVLKLLNANRPSTCRRLKKIFLLISFALLLSLFFTMYHVLNCTEGIYYIERNTNSDVSEKNVLITPALSPLCLKVSFLSSFGYFTSLRFFMLLYFGLQVLIFIYFFSL